jgi:hypothetical protein
MTTGSIAYGASKLQLLYNFYGKYGSPNPTGLLASDQPGNLYGVETLGGTYGQGAVFELTKDTAGNWQQIVLYSFTGGTDGGQPQDGVTLDSAGNIYGTTIQGGAVDSNPYCANQYLNGCGVVFELSRNGNQWQEAVLHTFQGLEDGLAPFAALTLHQGKLYGTTQWGGNVGGEWGYGCGTVFELSQTDRIWNELVLHRFNCSPDEGALPTSNVVFDTAGNLFSVTRYGGTGGGDGGCGTVFELSPAQGAWIFAGLYDFVCGGQDGQYPYGDLAIDRSGNIYGGTFTGGTGISCANSWWDFPCGTVFRISPASGSWQETILYNFQGGVDGSMPLTGVTMGLGGRLFGATQNGTSYGVGCGSAFELTPNPEDEWMLTVLYSFQSTAQCPLPISALLPNSSGELFGLTSTGGWFDEGTLYQVRAID